MKNKQDLSQNNGHSHCLICGRFNPHSLNLNFQPDEHGCVSAWFKGNDLLQGYDGLLHGGVIASLLDAAMTHCLFHEKVRAVTAEMNIRFIRPIASNSFLQIKACILSSYSPLYRMKSEIIIDNSAAAAAEAKFMMKFD